MYPQILLRRLQLSQFSAVPGGRAGQGVHYKRLFLLKSLSPVLR